MQPFFVRLILELPVISLTLKEKLFTMVCCREIKKNMPFKVKNKGKRNLTNCK